MSEYQDHIKEMLEDIQIELEFMDRTFTLLKGFAVGFSLGALIIFAIMVFR